MGQGNISSVEKLDPWIHERTPGVKRLNEVLRCTHVEKVITYQLRHDFKLKTNKLDGGGSIQ